MRLNDLRLFEDVGNFKPNFNGPGSGANLNIGPGSGKNLATGPGTGPANKYETNPAAKQALLKDIATLIKAVNTITPPSSDPTNSHNKVVLNIKTDILKMLKDLQEYINGTIMENNDVNKFFDNLIASAKRIYGIINASSTIPKGEKEHKLFPLMTEIINKLSNISTNWKVKT